jgi:LysR family transcriptional activator of nhaA
MDFLNYHHLRYFWVIAKEGSLRKASDKLHVSQPTISAQIKALEDVLGEKLFRRGGGLTLTETGHRAFTYADEIFSLGQELLHAVKEQPTARKLRIQIGIVDSLPKLVVYEIIRPIFSLPQSVEATCREGKPTDLLAQLASYRLDVVLSDESAPSSLSIKGYNHFIGECGISICAEPKLATKLKRKFPKSLDQAPALLPISNSALRRSLEEWFQVKGVRPRMVAEFEDSALMTAMAVDGLGFLPIPSLIAKDVLSRYGLNLVGHANQCRQQFYAISLERKLTHPALQELIKNAGTMLTGKRLLKAKEGGA